MRVLFLDLDGCSAACSQRAGDRAARANLPCPVHRLAQLAEATPDVHVVVHSNWRLQRNPQQLRVLLGPLSERFLGTTPRGHRWNSIVEWLVHHDCEVDDFCILDGNGCEFPRPAPRQLVVCSGPEEPGARARFEEWLTATGTPDDCASKAQTQPARE